MRLLLKASLLLAITIGIQWCIIRGVGGTLDEAQFTMRVYLAHLTGADAESEALVAEATSLRQRQEQRSRRDYPLLWSHPAWTAAAARPDREVEIG